MKLKKTLSLIISAVLLVSLVPVFCASAQSSSVSKIPSMISERAESLQADILSAKENDYYAYNLYKGAKLSTWAQKYADMAALLGLMPDEVCDYFAEPITRRDFAILSARYLSLAIGATYDELVDQFGSKSFSDCSNTEVKLCAALGIISGYTDGTFKPDNKITRQEAATMLSRIAMLTGCYANSYNGEFSDSSGLWGEAYIANTSKLKDPFMGAAVMSGVGNGSFSPSEYYTREQAIVTIVRLLGATTACHTGYGETQPSPFSLPKGTYFRADSKSRLTISYSNGSVLYSFITSDKGDLKGTSENGTVYYDKYTKSLKASESEIFFTLQSDFTILVKTDWLDEMYSEYNLFDGVYGKNSSSSTPTPTPTPTPTSSASAEDSDSGKKLPGDDGTTLDLGDAILPDPIVFIKDYFGPIVEPVNPDKTTELLQEIKDGTKRFDFAYDSTGSMTLVYRYWANRKQLERYANYLLNNSNILATDTRIKFVADFFASGGITGTKVDAQCGRPIIGKSTFSFSNDESSAVTIPDADLTIQLDNVSRKFTLDSSITLANMATKVKTTSTFMAIDPENHLIICYDYDDDVDGIDWMADCWALLVDVDSNGNLVLSGVFGESFSSGMRLFCKVNYTVGVSDS